MLYHASILDNRHDIDSILVDAEDTDVLVMAAYAAHEMNTPLCIYRRKRIVSASDLCCPSIAPLIIPFHAITGADAVSGFYGQSKKTIFKRVSNNIEEASGFLSQLGKGCGKDILWGSTSENFLLKFVYNDKKSDNIEEARTRKWKSMKNKTTMRLPPDRDSFEQHVLRANHQAQIWFNFNRCEEPPNPLNNGYRIQDNYLLPLPYTKECLPKELEECTDSALSENEDSSMSESSESGINTSDDESLDL